MKIPRRSSLLFLLNFFDAVLTIYWVRNGFATEGNHLMATLLDLGNVPFLAVKIAIGAVTAVVLWRWRELRIANYGLIFALFVYTGLMGVHFITGLNAAGLLPEEFVHDFSNWTHDIFAFFY